MSRPPSAVTAAVAALARSGCVITTRSASAGVTPGYSTLIRPMAKAPPITWAAMNAGAEAGAMPAKVSENIRPTVIAGFAKLVEEVKKYAAPM